MGFSHFSGFCFPPPSIGHSRISFTFYSYPFHCKHILSYLRHKSHFFTFISNLSHTFFTFSVILRSIFPIHMSEAPKIEGLPGSEMELPVKTLP